MDVGDNSYTPDTQEALESELAEEFDGEVTVTSYCKFKFTRAGPLFSRMKDGAENLAKLTTAILADARDGGHMREEIIVPRSKIESTIKVHGRKHVEALAKILMRGT